MGKGAGEKAGLRWTGHALVDVGMAGLCALAERESPEELTLADLDKAADLMEKEYYEEKFKTFLSCVFMNASFVQPKEGEQKRRAFIAQYLRSHRASPDPSLRGQRCVFSNEPATSSLVRTHLPLFSGEAVMNFRPNGQTNVPAAGPFVVALMFLPLASRRAEGKLLAVHADDHALTLQFARLYLSDNRRLLALPLPTERAAFHPEFERELPSWDAGKKHYKFADAKGPRSLVVADLTEIADKALPNDSRPHPIALNAYLLSNSGQGPSLEIFDVPSGLVSFIARASGARTQQAWKAVQRKFYPIREAADGGGKRRGKAEPIEGRPGWTRNPAFEELCAIFDGGFTDRALAARWLRQHVLGRIERGPKTFFNDTKARSWALAHLFLEEVMGMKPGRIEAIRAFADKVAGWIHGKNDRKVYRALMFGKLSEAQESLRRAQLQSAKGELLFGLDEYTSVWLHQDGDVFLVRDLICIRVVETLEELGYYRDNPQDQLDQANQEDSNDYEEQAAS